MTGNYLRIIDPAIDSHGIIAQLPVDNRDGGDSSQREGMFLLLAYSGHKQGKITQQEYDEIATRYVAIYDRLRKDCMPGEIRRHDGGTTWADQNGQMSRDQWTPNAISIGLVGGWRRKLDMVFGMALRGFLFTTNIYPSHIMKTDPSYKLKFPDVAVLSSHGIIFRWSPIFWPVLLITDLEILVNSLIWLYNFKYNQTNTDILNHVNLLIQAKYKVPTPVSWFARTILPLSKVQACLDDYFNNGGPALNIIAKAILPDVWK